MSAPASFLGKSKPRPASRIAQRWREAIVALFILGFFLHFCLHALYVRFAADEMMNMFWYWEPGAWKLVWANLTFSNSIIRPMAAFYYLPLFKMFGFNPLPFNAVRLALLAGNASLFYCLAARISGLRMVGALATVFIAYHADLGNIAYIGSPLFDAFFGGSSFFRPLSSLRVANPFRPPTLAPRSSFLA